MRALQALGASALLAAAFDALDGGGAGRRLWVGAAVAGTAAGPALGGALTELFDWRAIFVAQAPIALAAAPALCGEPDRHACARRCRARRATCSRRPALALLSGALTAVVFLLVLLLISGWSVEPLAAAAAVTVLPLAAVAGSFVPGAPAARALAGCLLVAGGIAGLAFLPEASALWTLLAAAARRLRDGHGVPGARGRAAATSARAASRPRCCRCATWASRWRWRVLAPIVAAELDDQVQLARERGTALVLDAALPPTDKIELAPRLFANLETEDPRDALRAGARARAPPRHDRRPRPAQPPAAARPPARRRRRAARPPRAARGPVRRHARRGRARARPPARHRPRRGPARRPRGQGRRRLLAAAARARAGHARRRPRRRRARRRRRRVQPGLRR